VFAVVGQCREATAAQLKVEGQPELQGARSALLRMAASSAHALTEQALPEDDLGFRGWKPVRDCRRLSRYERGSEGVNTYLKSMTELC
jgi:hypothetical protein